MQVCVWVCACERLRTLRSVCQAQPAQSAAVAADAGGPAGTGVQGNRPDHQRQRQRQIQPPGDVHVHLQEDTEEREEREEREGDMNIH